MYGEMGLRQAQVGNRQQLKAAGSKPASHSQKSSGMKQAFKHKRRGIRSYIVMSLEYRRGSLVHRNRHCRKVVETDNCQLKVLSRD